MGQRGAPADTVSIPNPRRPAPEPPHFDMVLRGYDRIEVDEYIAMLLEENAALRRELDSRAQRGDARPPATQAEQAQTYDVDTPAEDSFGFRAEKLMRLAERESAEIRTRAARDAEATEATARRQAEEQLRAAEREADEIRSNASQEATKVRKHAAQELSRLGNLHRATKGEIRRLAELLNAELERPDPEGLAPSTGNAPAEEPDASSGAPASNH